MSIANMMSYAEMSNSAVTDPKKLKLSMPPACPALNSFQSMDKKVLLKKGEDDSIPETLSPTADYFFWEQEDPKLFDEMPLNYENSHDCWSDGAQIVGMKYDNESMSQEPSHVLHWGDLATGDTLMEQNVSDIPDDGINLVDFVMNDDIRLDDDEGIIEELIFPQLDDDNEDLSDINDIIKRELAEEFADHAVEEQEPMTPVVLEERALGKGRPRRSHTLVPEVQIKK